jgi:hypothetical protein
MSVPARKSKGTPLPVNYIAAKQALAECKRVDECKSWADKALALKSYAKQLNDEAMENMAQKIRDRAMKRGGALLMQVKAAKGANQNIRAAGGPKVQTRKEVAEKAGLSPRQAKQMIRVASVPDEQFERMVERGKPATVELLASRGGTTPLLHVTCVSQKRQKLSQMRHPRPPALSPPRSTAPGNALTPSGSLMLASIQSDRAMRGGGIRARSALRRISASFVIKPQDMAVGVPPLTFRRLQLVCSRSQASDKR